MPSRHQSANAVMVLLVQDNKAQAKILQSQLERHHYKAVIVDHGKAALDFLKRRRPALIIAESILPEMDGRQLCRRLKSDKKLSRIPFILLTSLDDPADVLKGIDCGADDLIAESQLDHNILSRINSVMSDSKKKKKHLNQTGLEIIYGGKKYVIPFNRQRVAALIFTIYEAAFKKNRLLEKKLHKLRQTLPSEKAIKGVLPMCAKCRKIRNSQGSWQFIEEYIREQAQVRFSHGLCPACMEELYPELEDIHESTPPDAP